MKFEGRLMISLPFYNEWYSRLDKCNMFSLRVASKRDLKHKYRNKTQLQDPLYKAIHRRGFGRLAPEAVRSYFRGLRDIELIFTAGVPSQQIREICFRLMRIMAAIRSALDFHC